MVIFTCLCTWLVNEKELDKDKVYDAFISYVNQDEDFVCELVQRLESGLKPFKLCIHERDFIAGDQITTNIYNSINKSRRTIIVLSKAFTQSRWGLMEFHTAYAQTMKEKSKRLIVILKGDLNLDKDVSDEMKAYFKSNTYIKHNDPWFWKRLYYAMPHRETNQKMENICNNIDKLDLINNGHLTPNHLSTPAGDPLVLKMNEFQFTVEKAVTPASDLEDKFSVIK